MRVHVNEYNETNLTINQKNRSERANVTNEWSFRPGKIDSTVL